MGLTDYEKVWEENRQAGEKALRRGQLAKAEEHFRVTVVLAELLWPKTERHAQCLNDLGSLHLARAQAAEALPFLERALAILSDVKGHLDPALLPVLENYAQAMRKTNRTAEAENLERRIKELKRRLSRT